MTQRSEDVRTIKRKSLAILGIAVLACAGMFSASAQLGGQSSHKPVNMDPIVGTWECSGSPPPFIVIKNFNAGGTMMEVDNVSTQESPTVGTWKRTGDLTYFLVARQISFDPSGTFAGVFHYTQPLNLDESQTTLKGTFDATFVDPNGNVSPAGTGEVSCARMPFTALP